MNDRMEIGDTVGDYRIIGEIGRGGMGVVFRGEHVSTGQAAALKVLPPELLDDDDSRRRFAREAQYAGSLVHPNIVALYGAGETDGVHYMAMQYVAGGDLRELLGREGQLMPDRAIALLRQIAGALDAAHAAGILHRDLKPENVLIAPREVGDDEVHCYLTDFGLSKNSSQDSVALTAKGSYVGTFHYTAPEMIIGTEVDHRVNVYSLGCLLYQLLIGEPPFPGHREVEVLHAHLREAPPRVTDRRPELPAALDDVIAAAMAKDPDQRPDSCMAVVEAAEAAIAGVQIQAPVAAPPLRRVTPAPDAGAQAGAPAAAQPGLAARGEPVPPPAPPAPPPAPPVPSTTGLVVLEVTAGNAIGTVIEVTDELLIGRSADGAGRLADDIEISRRHARIFRTDGGRYAVEDLVSTNGTYVNGLRINAVTPLEVGDWMDAGTTTLVVRVCEPGPPVVAAAEPAAAVDEAVGAPAAEPALATIVEPPETESLEPVEPEPVEPESVEPESVEPGPVEPGPVEPGPEPGPGPAAVGVELADSGAGAPSVLSLRLEIDLARRSVRVQLDEESAPVTLVNRDGRWSVEQAD